MMIPVILASVACAIGGQFSLKTAMNRVGRVGRRRRLSWRAGGPSLLRGFLLYGLATVLWLYVLSRVELSFAFPFLALTYVGVLAVARLVLGEALDRSRWIGSALILTGVLLVSLSAQ